VQIDSGGGGSIRAGCLAPRVSHLILGLV